MFIACESVGWPDAFDASGLQRGEGGALLPRRGVVVFVDAVVTMSNGDWPISLILCVLVGVSV